MNFDIVPAEELLREKLNIPEKEKVYRIHRLRLADKEPFAVETSYVPCKYYPGLNEEVIEKNGLYSTMKALSDLSPNNAVETFEAVILDAEQAERLHVKRPAAGLYIIP